MANFDCDGSCCLSRCIEEYTLNFFRDKLVLTKKAAIFKSFRKSAFISLFTILWLHVSISLYFRIQRMKLVYCDKCGKKFESGSEICSVCNLPDTSRPSDQTLQTKPGDSSQLEQQFSGLKRKGQTSDSYNQLNDGYQADYQTHQTSYSSQNKSYNNGSSAPKLSLILSVGFLALILIAGIVGGAIFLFRTYSVTEFPVLTEPPQTTEEPPANSDTLETLNDDNNSFPSTSSRDGDNLPDLDLGGIDYVLFSTLNISRKNNTLIDDDCWSVGYDIAIKSDRDVEELQDIFDDDFFKSLQQELLEVYPDNTDLKLFISLYVYQYDSEDSLYSDYLEEEAGFGFYSRSECGSLGQTF